MTRRCSHCSNNGHNSRTCPTRGGVKLFGVRLTDGSIKKSASMGNLSSAAHYYSSSSAAASPNPASPSSDTPRDPRPIAEGYVSDDPAHTSCSSNCRGERKKGTPWTEEEHRLFLLGLQKLGKGDWRGIARNYVITRTPTQVASHAQKYFIRQTNSTRRKRRSSLFDMVPEMSIDSQSVLEEETFLHGAPQVSETENMNMLPTLSLSLDRDCEPMESTSNNTHIEVEENTTYANPTPVIPTFLPSYLPIPFPFWSANFAPTGEDEGKETSRHQVLKPTPILSKEPVNLDELVGLSNLTLGAAAPDRIEPSSLSLKLLGAPSRQSAFHVNQPVKRDSNAIPAA